jgi:hypothetical protein
MRCKWINGRKQTNSSKNLICTRMNAHRINPWAGIEAPQRNAIDQWMNADS